jgi:hypothetical protein
VVAPVVLACGISAGALAQGTFSLGFSGPDFLAGDQGTAVSGEFVCTLTQEGVAPPTNPEDPIHTGFGAQGWSLSLTAENGLISSITTAGTAADTVANGGFWSGGFNKTQVVDPAKNAGKNGVVSAIVLSFTDGNVLPDNQTYDVARIVLGAAITDPGSTARLFYEDGLVGAGQPVSNVVTVGGNTVTPGMNDKTIELRPIVKPPSCCDAADRLNFGFSGAAVRAGGFFEGIVGVDPSKIGTEEEDCSAHEGTIDVPTPEGEIGEGSVFVNIISQLPPDPAAVPPNLGGAQGWSMSIHLNGDMEMTSVTTAGTAADTVANGGFWDGGFNKTQVVDPAKNSGQRGCVSAIVLSFTNGNTLPTTGTESVLEIGVRANSATGPEGDPPVMGQLQFNSGLVGAGQPVNNVITVGGNTETACNSLDSAQVRAGVSVAFTRPTAPPIDNFIRGNANEDLKVNIADPVYTLNALLRGGPGVACEDAADANDDGLVDASDAVFTINYLFRGQASPPAPFPACGDDPTEDTLSCPTGSTPTSCP